MNGRARRGDAGSVTPVLLAGAGFLVAGVCLVLTLTAPVLARHRASVAADLGAVSGAPAAVLGEDEACTRARLVVVADGATVVSCTLTGQVLDLTVAVEVHALAGLHGRVTARARAGPATTEPQ